MKKFPENLRKITTKLCQNSLIQPRKKKWTQTQRKFMKWAKNVNLSMKLNKKLWYVFTDTVLQLSCGRALTGMDFYVILKVTSSH